MLCILHFCAFLLFTSYLFSHHTHSFLTNARILLSVPNLTHSQLISLCGFVLFSYLSTPPTWSSSFRYEFILPSYHELLPFVPENPFLSLGHHVLLSLSFVAPSSTTGNSCWWQMSHNQLQACSWLQAWGKLQTFFTFALCSSAFIQMQQSHLFLKYSFLENSRSLCTTKTEYL